MDDRNLDVAIIGAGPAGLSAAFELKRLGIDRIAVFERESEAGGVPRHCAHSLFRIGRFGRVYTGPALSRRLAVEAHSLDIDIRLGHSIARLEPGGRLFVISPEGTKQIRAKRVIVATGTREKPRSARLLPGDRPIGIITTGALQAYVNLHGLLPFRRPVVVGTELVSLSALLTCLWCGARPVAILEENAGPVARWPLTLFPRLARVPLYCGAEITDVVGRDRVEGISFTDRLGRAHDVACDGLLLTGNFTPESSLFLTSEVGVNRATNGPDIDQFGRCADPSCFAAGNILGPVDTGGRAFREGRRVAGAVAADLGKPGPEDCVPVETGAEIRLAVPQRIRRWDGPMALEQFQVRMARTVKGILVLEIDGKRVWHRRGLFKPERRIFVPIPAEARRATSIRIRIEGSKR